jgi:hypothetical protein
MVNQTKITPAIRTKVWQLRGYGLTQVAIAKRLSIGQATVSEIVNSPRLWRNFGTISVYRENEGGIGQGGAIHRLWEAKIPARKGYSPYVGQVGVQVPERYMKRASRILFGSM